MAAYCEKKLCLQLYNQMNLKNKVTTIRKYQELYIKNICTFTD